ncbi:28S ribosomal protein S18b, mitochondrial [Tribolium madens]|uniref:28S ribosomal protein S18b, mitochondrial n=1 Tax=Tribolium madens TaxID=41895 RepID=UPI001CF7476C|nr:28S ribosomal protein S18b, mitochondrial [Tribolium madens]
MFSSLLVKNFAENPLWKRTFTISAAFNAFEAVSSAEPKLEVREITKDRTKPIPVETSIRYLKSAAYRQTYGDQPVWVLYRRNHKGSIPPRKTRKTCVRGGQISCGNPCPICRDEYLVLHENNVELLKQFVCQHTGSILSYSKTGLCQRKHQELLVAIRRAVDSGLITFDVPPRHYDYSEFYPELRQ